MQKNPHEYDKSISWQTPQHQQYTGGYPAYQQPAGSYSIYQQPEALQTQRPGQPGRGTQPKPPARMPKARALALAQALKRGFVVVSLAVFALFSGLVAYHQAGATTAQKSSSSTQATPTATSSQQDDNGFFNQQEGNNLGTNTTSSQGSSSGSNNSSSSSPASGSGVS